MEGVPGSLRAPRAFVLASLSALLAALLLAAPPASAQPVTSTGQAESLFRDGQKLTAEGKLAEACIAFEGSYRLDPVLSTLLNVANCRENNGQFATAWSAFVEAERRTRTVARATNLVLSARYILRNKRVTT